jgi:hypothetical protein
MRLLKNLNSFSYQNADRMRPEDVGLSPDLSFFRARDATRGGGTPTITHTTIYKCPNFSVGRIISIVCACLCTTAMLKKLVFLSNLPLVSGRWSSSSCRETR